MSAAWIALAVYLAGLLLTFGVRTWMQIRGTGTSGYRGFSGRPGSLAWWGGVLFPAAVLLGLLAPVLVLVGAAASWSALAHGTVAVTGFVVALVGLVVVLTAQTAMGSWVGYALERANGLVGSPVRSF
jgi:protein-S-isoprenylcysteine O-methyltransferase Ste14